MSTLGEDQKYFIVHEALLFLTFIPTVVLFFCSICMVRRRNDPARSFVLYLKIALALFVLGVLLEVVSYAFTIALYYLSYDSSYASLSRAEEQLENVSEFFDYVSEAFAFLALGSLVHGLEILRTGAHDGRNKMMKYISYAFAFIVVVLAVAELGLRVDGWATFDFSSAEFEPNHILTANQLGYSIVVLLFALSLSLLGRSIVSKIQCNSEPRLHQASTFLLVCCTLFVCRTSLDLAFEIKYVPVSLTDAVSRYDIYMEVLFIVFTTWPMFIIFSILFALAAKKATGLWSTEQNFMMFNPNDGQAGWGNELSQTAEVQHHPGWQPVPHGMQPGYYHQQRSGPTEMYSGSPQVPEMYSGSPRVPEMYSGSPQVPEMYSGTPQVAEMHTGSPPPHAEAMGLFHQADGVPPQAAAHVYPAKN